MNDHLYVYDYSGKDTTHNSVFSYQDAAKIFSNTLAPSSPVFSVFREVIVPVRAPVEPLPTKEIYSPCMDQRSYGVRGDNGEHQLIKDQTSLSKPSSGIQNHMKKNNRE